MICIILCFIGLGFALLAMNEAILDMKRRWFFIWKITLEKVERYLNRSDIIQTDNDKIIANIMDKYINDICNNFARKVMNKNGNSLYRHNGNSLYREWYL